MIEKVVVSMAQLNQTAGDLEGNFKRIAEAAEKAKHSDILVTPELSLCGYPPEDLLDPITSTLLDNPYIIKPSGTIVNKTTLDQQIQSNGYVDPLKQIPFTPEDIAPYPKKLAEVEAWKNKILKSFNK